jgi:hypothetical protein
MSNRRSGRCNCGRNSRRDLGRNLLGDLVCDRNGDRVGDEEVHGGKGRADEELGDLERGKGALDGVGDAVAESRDGVVGVLESVRQRAL